ncbi:MutS family DNA mismatch repair protein [Larkinella ripae]
MFQSAKKISAFLKDSYGKLKQQSFQFSLIEYYFVNRTKTDAQVISDKTYHDLDFDEIFMFVDRTVSRVGQQFLYAKLRKIDLTNTGNQRLEQLTQAFQNDPELRETIGLHLHRLSHQDAYYIPSLFLKPHLQPPDWFRFARWLSVASLFLIILIPFYSAVLLVLPLLLMVNYGIHYWNKKNVYHYLLSLPQLLLLNQVAKEILSHEVLKPDTDELNRAIQTVDEVGQSMFFFKLNAKLESEIGMVVEAITELFKALFLLEPLLLFHILKQLDTKRADVERVFQYVGLTDTALSISSLRAGLTTYCQPAITDTQKSLTAVDLYHPLIINSVANSISLMGKSALITGSNMSGKTTFIRAVGINAILAQTINTCFAREFVLAPTRIFSAIRISDDLLNDKSYYFEEVQTIREMIEASSSDYQTLFLLDELFKGTNSIERIAAGKAVLTYLNKNQHLVFVCTHDIELTDYLKETFNLYHFTEIVDHDAIAFDYKLKAGNLKTRNAIRILELNGYPSEIIDEAKVMAQKMTGTAD